MKSNEVTSCINTVSLWQIPLLQKIAYPEELGAKYSGNILLQFQMISY